MEKVKVGVLGYGTIGQRLADGVARMGDMELVGVANRHCSGCYINFGARGSLRL